MVATPARVASTTEATPANSPIIIQRVRRTPMVIPKVIANVIHSPGVADTKKKVGMNKVRRLSFITLVYRFGRSIIGLAVVAVIAFNTSSEEDLTPTTTRPSATAETITDADREKLMQVTIDLPAVLEVSWPQDISFWVFVKRDVPDQYSQQLAEIICESSGFTGFSTTIWKGKKQVGKQHCY